MIAKTCKSNTSGKKVIYTLENPDSITYLGKKDISLNQLMACVKLVDYVRDKNDLELIQTEIDELTDVGPSYVNFSYLPVFQQI